MAVSLRPVPRNDLPLFKQRLQTAFTQAVAERFPEWTKTIPPDSDIDETLAAPGAEAFHLLASALSEEGLRETEETIGGAIITANGEGRYTLDFIFVDPAFANRGLGQATWRAIEAHYPDARLWVGAGHPRPRTPKHSLLRELLRVLHREVLQRTSPRPAFPPRGSGQLPGHR